MHRGPGRLAVAVVVAIGIVGASASGAAPRGAVDEQRMNRDGALVVLVGPSVLVSGSSWQSASSVSLGVDAGRDGYIGFRLRFDGLDALRMGVDRRFVGLNSGVDLVLRVTRERRDGIAPLVAAKTGFAIQIACPRETRQSCPSGYFRGGVELGATVPVSDAQSLAFVLMAEALSLGPTGTAYQLGLSTGLLF